MERHFVQFDAIVSDLKAAGATMKEPEVVTHLLMILPKSYEGIRKVLETLDPEGLTVAKVKSRLLSEEIKRFETGGASSDVGEHSAAAFMGKKKKFLGKCWRCKQQGHKAGECTAEYTDAERGTDTHRDTRSGRVEGRKVFQLNRGMNSFDEEESIRGAFAFVARGKAVEGILKLEDLQIRWVIDSGCTDHMVNRDSFFTVEKELSTPYPVSLAEEGQAIKAIKVGFIAATSSVNGREYKCDISEILYAPGLRHNLLSVSRLEKAGCVVIFRAGKVELWADNVLFGVGERKCDLCNPRQG